MTAATATQTGATAGRPPLPHEHGAWMMLYAPLVTGLAAYKVDPGPAVLLVVAATAAFLAGGDGEGSAPSRWHQSHRHTSGRAWRQARGPEQARPILGT